jgi:superfamily II DNA/RNA helicase
MSRSAEAHATAEVTQSAQPRKRATFDDLGLHPPIVASLRAAFPNVQYPTEAQEKFIPAILSGKDVLLKDATGSGKYGLAILYWYSYIYSILGRSFGLVLALLNKPRLKSTDASVGKFREKQHITSLVIVPHRDLAHQLYHWIQRLAAAAEVYPPPPLASLAQVVVRDGLSHLTTGLHNLRETPPHILIGTPQALFDIWQEDPISLQLSHLSCVVVDEVDYLIETLPKKDPNRSFRKAVIKASRKLQAHPGVTRELLDAIYAERKKINERRHDEPGAIQYRRRSGLVEQFGGSPSPQLIMSSATLRSHLNDYLYDESGWLNRDNLLKVKGATAGTEKLHDQDEHNALARNSILHSVLLVSDTSIENIAGAVPHSSDTEQHQPIDAATLFAHPTKVETVEIDRHLVESEFHLGGWHQADK